MGAALEPLCHNPLCPLHYVQVPKAEIVKQDVRYFCGPTADPIRLCTGCTNVIRMVSQNPYGIRPEFFL
jgi:hypothetical protein